MTELLTPQSDGALELRSKSREIYCAFTLSDVSYRGKATRIMLDRTFLFVSLPTADGDGWIGFGNESVSQSD